MARSTDAAIAEVKINTSGVGAVVDLARAAAGDSDLQARHDDMAATLTAIDDALSVAGFPARPEGGAEDAPDVSVLDRLGVALATLAVKRDCLLAVAERLEEAGILRGTEEYAAAVTVVVMRMKAAEAGLEQSMAETEAERAKAAKAADALAKRPKAVKGVIPKTLRPCGPAVAPGVGKDFDPDLLLLFIADAETVELAFSDGKHELDDVPPFMVSGDAWTVRNGQLLLTGIDQLLLHGMGRDGQAMDLKGYGLFVDGDLLAYAPRVNGPLVIAPGASVNLKDDVVFG